MNNRNYTRKLAYIDKHLYMLTELSDLVYLEQHDRHILASESGDHE